MERKLMLYQKVLEEERQYSEDISATLKDFSKNVAEFVKVAAEQRKHDYRSMEMREEDLQKIAALTKSMYAKVKSLTLAVKEDKPQMPPADFETGSQMMSSRLTEVKKQMESSNKSFISMGCCLTELLSVLTFEERNVDLLIVSYVEYQDVGVIVISLMYFFPFQASQMRGYFKFVEKTLISFFNTVHERENLPTSNYKFVCLAASVVGNIATSSGGRELVMTHEKTHFLLKTFLNLLCRLRYPQEVQLIEIFLKFLCSMSLEDEALKIIQNHLTVMEQIIDYVNLMGKLDLQYMAIILLFNTLDDHLSSDLFLRLSSKLNQISWDALLNSPNEIIQTSSRKLHEQIMKKLEESRESE